MFTCLNSWQIVIIHLEEKEKKGKRVIEFIIYLNPKENIHRSRKPTKKQKVNSKQKYLNINLRLIKKSRISKNEKHVMLTH